MTQSLALSNPRTGITVDTHIKIARNLAHLLDTEFSIFGFKFGLDPIIGLIPGIGDLISVTLSAYLILIALQLQIPKYEIAKMLFNLAVDFIFGLIPILGDLGDAWYKANMRNLRIIERYARI